jgi:biotin transport system substrate-specific component
MQQKIKARSQAAVLPQANLFSLASYQTALLMRSLGLALAASLFIALCAHIAIPLVFTPVPITMQPFAVLVIGLLLSPELAMASTAAYLIEGALGLPVFTPHGPGGMVQLFGPTGGYLLSYPVVAPLTSALWQRAKRSYLSAFAITAATSLVTLAMGATWLAVVTHASIRILLTQAILPFLPGDALKVAAAAAVGVAATRFRRK